MTGKDDLIRFKKMWTWLSGYPAHDQDYYMEHVITVDETWFNKCPLANRAGETCDGCIAIWQTADGTLCTDPGSPLHKWRNTGKQYPDYRSFYASQVAVLAMKAIRDRGFDKETPPVFHKDYIHSQIHG